MSISKYIDIIGSFFLYLLVSKVYAAFFQYKYTLL